MTTEQESWWAGDAGKAYIARNRLDWSLRVPFWDDVINWTNPGSVLEIGCNIGSNLKAIRSIDRELNLVGVDVNVDAITEATIAGLNTYEMSGAEAGDMWPDSFDLVFTAGVLIHVAPEHLSSLMDSIIKASKRYVLAIEYAADKEEHVEYRGCTDRLWRRPFGEFYRQKGLRLIDTWDAGNGFDRCTAWLLEKK